MLYSIQTLYIYIYFQEKYIELSIKEIKSYIVYVLKNSRHCIFITNIECKVGLVRQKNTSPTPVYGKKS